MFNLLLNSPLSDVLAPNLTPIEEFISYWDSFTNFFNQENNENQKLCKCRIETTNLSNFLSKMCDILVEEQAEYIKTNKGAIAPSVEYAIQNKVLDTLSVLAQADTPLGICPRIMLFFDRLLSECKTDLIPHKCVYSPLNKLIMICGKVPAGPYESIEMLFLSSFTMKICQKPEFLSFFLADSFPLINSLLCLLCSPDCEISKRAGDCIIRLSCIFDEDAQRVICQKTPFCSKIINQIVTYYNEIPRWLDHEKLEVAICSFRTDFTCDSSFNNSVRRFLCFLKWYIFFDMLICHLPKNFLLSSTLISQLKIEFLESCILPDLLSEGFKEKLDSIDNAFLTTVLLSNCLRNTESDTLFNCISEFLIIPDQINQNIPSKHKNYHLYQTLLERCSFNPNENDKNLRKKTKKLTFVTIQLFEDVLMRPSYEIINFLILQHIRKRKYLEIKDEEMCETFDSVMQKFDIPEMNKEIQNCSKELCKISKFASLPTVNSLKLKAIVYYLVSLIPNELKLSDKNEILEYSVFLKEAIKGETLFLTSCFAHWPENYASDKLLSSDNDNEGPFIRMILNNLDSMLSLPYDINLQIFSLIARISLIPDESINAFLLDSTINTKNNWRNLFGILHRLVDKLQISVQGIPDLQQQLYITKNSLLQEDNNKCPQSVFEDNITCNTLQSLVVLDEFLKEFVSIILVKNRLISKSKELI